MVFSIFSTRANAHAGSEPLIIGNPSNVTTLNHLLYLYGLVESKTIGEVVDTSNALCYGYD